MSEHNIEVESGKSLRLKTAGKYCDRDIIVTATGGGGGDTEAAYQEGLVVGIEQGKQAEYDAFWDSFQQNGERTDYKNSFGTYGWTTENFKPKYDMFPKSSYGMFSENTLSIDLQATLEELGVTLDFKNCTNLNFTFFKSKFTRVGIVDTRSCTSALSQVFSSCPNLHTIDKVILRDDGTSKLVPLTFTSSGKIANITFEGVIGVDFDFSAPQALTDESIQSVIDALKDLTGETALTVTFCAGVGAKLTDEQKATITAKNWTLVY